MCNCAYYCKLQSLDWNDIVLSEWHSCLGGLSSLFFFRVFTAVHPSRFWWTVTSRIVLTARETMWSNYPKPQSTCHKFLSSLLAFQEWNILQRICALGVTKFPDKQKMYLAFLTPHCQLFAMHYLYTGDNSVASVCSVSSVDWLGVCFYQTFDTLTFWWWKYAQSSFVVMAQAEFKSHR